MKAIIFLVLSMFVAGCLTKQTDIDYPDYPPGITAHNLQTEFDTCRWFLYRLYGLSLCYTYIDTVSIYGYRSLKGINREFPSFEIALDTFAYRGDTILFFYKFKAADNLHCITIDYFDRFDSIPGTPFPTKNAIAVSLSQDTVLYLAEGIFRDNIKDLNNPNERWYLGGSRYWGDLYSSPRLKKMQEEDLKKFIVNNPGKTHPWLLKQARKRGWLPDQPTEK
ncbi:MAG: hypothetical protein IPM47_11680 [Sphingobacteriales bacterium]|nr:MAG: hypothetical protein IPM47_11680 [Sphingobacteriales bacterium]